MASLLLILQLIAFMPLVVLWVADTGAGLAETAAPGTGLTNLRARLQADYGDLLV